MKFNEKLIELRKKEGLSQEELGYKLNVTRQTVSKWELGQTTPEMDKLIEMSKLFNVSIDELANENETIGRSNETIADQPIVENSSKNNKIVLILVGALIIVIVLILMKLFTGFAIFNKAADVPEGVLDKFFSIFDKTTDIISNQIDSIDQVGDSYNTLNTGNILNNLVNNYDQLTNTLNNIDSNFSNQINETQNKISVSDFNSHIELYAGTAPKLFAETVLDNIVTSNKKNDRKITVKYNKTETKDEKEIKNIKKIIHNMSDFVSFDISCEYDEEGYIYEVIIEKM